MHFLFYNSDMDSWINYISLLHMCDFLNKPFAVAPLNLTLSSCNIFRWISLIYFFKKVFYYTKHSISQIYKPLHVYVSESDIFRPIDYISDIEILVSFERDMFADYFFKNKMKIFLFFMSISPLWNTCLKHQKQCICQI